MATYSALKVNTLVLAQPIQIFFSNIQVGLNCLWQQIYYDEKRFGKTLFDEFVLLLLLLQLWRSKGTKLVAQKHGEQIERTSVPLFLQIQTNVHYSNNQSFYFREYTKLQTEVVLHNIAFFIFLNLFFF